jgi:predicted nucleotide-binding protein
VNAALTLLARDGHVETTDVSSDLAPLVLTSSGRWKFLEIEESVDPADELVQLFFATQALMPDPHAVWLFTERLKSTAVRILGQRAAGAIKKFDQISFIETWTGPVEYTMPPTKAEQQKCFKDAVDRTFEILEDLQRELNRSSLPAEVAVAATGTHGVDSEKNGERKVFLVHGHDEAARNAVELTLIRLGLTPIILSQKPNAGRTIIEKFETHADVSAAVVILSGDDFGYSRAAGLNEAKLRARQNVIFEMGFFYGRLGRDKVIALLDPAMERPSDIEAIAFVPMSAGDWRAQLARDLVAAGLTLREGVFV